MQKALLTGEYMGKAPVKWTRRADSSFDSNQSYYTEDTEGDKWNTFWKRGDIDLRCIANTAKKSATAFD